jgi:hypothetical protein
MRVRDAILIEGSTKFAILCYGVFAVSRLDLAFDALHTKVSSSNGQVHRLLGDEWPNGLLLNELVVEDERRIAGSALDALTRMMAADSCLGAVCMYDGAFGTYDDILAPHAASQTYGFCLRGGEPVLVLDEHILASSQWGSIVAQCRPRLG